jgi:hypothetical protein
VARSEALRPGNLRQDDDFAPCLVFLHSAVRLGDLIELEHRADLNPLLSGSDLLATMGLKSSTVHRRAPDELEHLVDPAQDDLLHLAGDAATGCSADYSNGEKTHFQSARVMQTARGVMIAVLSRSLELPAFRVGLDGTSTVGVDHEDRGYRSRKHR